MIKEPVALPILETSQVGQARRLAIALSTRLGFNETERGKVGIIVTEIANNLVQHAKDGLLLLQVRTSHETTGLEILALDKGPGISNLSECLRDGFSTAGTSGHGLGAIARLSDCFDIHSVPDTGTALLSHLWSIPNPTLQPEDPLEVGAVCLPKIGEEVAGDAWAIHQQAGRTLLLVSDGLGHGPLAAQASWEAVRIFRENAHKSPGDIVAAAHVALRSTRGAALAVAEVNFRTAEIRFAGVGNISGTVLSPAKRYSMVSHNGTVGHEARKIQELIYPWPQGGLLILHSDGLGTQWRLERYPGLVAKHPSLIAGVLYRDYNRSRDDVTVLVAREANEQSFRF